MYVDTSQQLRAVLNAVDAAILMVDINFKVVMCNSRFEDFFGISPSLIINQDKREAITTVIKWRVRNPEDFQKKLFWLYDNPELISQDEVEVVIPRHRILNRFSGPVFNGKGLLLGRVEVYSEITHAKSLQKDLEYKNDQLFLLNAAATAISESLELYTLGNLFIRRIMPVVGAKGGLLYIKRSGYFELVISILQSSEKQLPQFIYESLPENIFWGSVSSLPINSLRSCLNSGFCIVFPSYNNKDINGICLLQWDQLNDKWLDRPLFESIGIQLGIGISNAHLYEEAQWLAILQERDRLAMEMHDGLGQTLGYLGLGMDSLQKRIENDNLDGCLDLLSRLRQVLDSSYADVREAIIGLRVDIFKGQGFYKALENYLQEFSRLTNINTTFTVTGNYQEPDLDRQLHIVRVIQEALTNVRRHSLATKAQVILNYESQNILVSIKDNGKGFDLVDDCKELSYIHQGLQIMERRAIALGGNLKINTTKGAGTNVELIIPKKA